MFFTITANGKNHEAIFIENHSSINPAKKNSYYMVKPDVAFGSFMRNAIFVDWIENGSIQKEIPDFKITKRRL